MCSIVSDMGDPVDIRIDPSPRSRRIENIEIKAIAVKSFIKFLSQASLSRLTATRKPPA